MSATSEQKLRDMAIWFKQHKAECSDPDKRTQFLERAVDHLIWLTTYLVRTSNASRGVSQGRACPSRTARLSISPEALFSMINDGVRANALNAHLSVILESKETQIIERLIALTRARKLSDEEMRGMIMQLVILREVATDARQEFYEVMEEEDG